MEKVSIIGLDIAKSVFQAHGADALGGVVFRKKIIRAKLLEFFASLPPCTVAMEACGGAHHWGREIGKLGHEVKLIAPKYVKPFVKRQKNDAADAEAIWRGGVSARPCGSSRSRARRRRQAAWSSAPATSWSASALRSPTPCVVILPSMASSFRKAPAISRSWSRIWRIQSFFPTRFARSCRSSPRPPPGWKRRYLARQGDHCGFRLLRPVIPI